MDQQLTIKLNEIEPDALQECPAACDLLRQQALFSGLVLSMHQDADHRGCENRQDDGKCSVSPTPVASIELFGCGRSTISRDDVGRRSEGISQTTIPKTGGVGRDDIDGEGHTGEADIVENLERFMSNIPSINN